MSVTAPAVNSVANSSTTNTLTTTVNGVAGTGVNIINSNALTQNGSNQLISTVNGVAGTALTAAVTGDVTGNLGASTVAKIQGRDVATTLPTSGQVLTYNTTTSKWEPATAAPVTTTVSNTNTAPNSLTTTVNGVTGTVVPIVNTVAELSPGPVSVAPLLHPQRQRELIEQAAGMSTRQVAVLLAAAAPEVAPPRDTLRAVAPDRYTLKVTIDQECERGLRLLKDLMSHLDPRMSWGDLVARLVREAVVGHDPRGGGNGQRRRRSAGAAPRRTPKKKRAAGAAAEPAQRVNQSSRRAPNRTRATGVPGSPALRGGGDTPAPQGGAAATERQNPSAMLANAASPSQSAPAALSDGARAGGVPAGAPAATAPQFAGGASAHGAHAGAGVAVAPVAPVATPAPEPALGAFPDDGRSGASAGAAAHTTRDAVHSSHQSPRRRPIPAAVRRHVWQRDGGRCCYRDPLTGRRCNSSHLLQIDHLLPVAQGGGEDPANLRLACFAHHRMRHGHGPALPPEPPM